MMVSMQNLKQVIAAPDATTNLFPGIHAKQQSDALMLRGSVDLGADWTLFGSAGTAQHADRKSTRLNSSHLVISYAVFCLQKKKRKALPVGGGRPDVQQARALPLSFVQQVLRGAVISLVHGPLALLHRVLTGAPKKQHLSM